MLWERSTGLNTSYTLLIDKIIDTYNNSHIIEKDKKIEIVLNAEFICDRALKYKHDISNLPIVQNNRYRTALDMEDPNNLINYYCFEVMQKVNINRIIENT